MTSERTQGVGEVARPSLAPVAAARQPRRTQLALLGLIVAVTFGVFWPTVHNGFLPLGFDDAIITDTDALRGLGWANLRAMATEFNHAHYVPLTMLSLALDYHCWGLNPFGYHLTNVVLHALTAACVCVFLWGLMPSRSSAVVATLLFALHPIQLEAVSLAIQRKTVLSGLLFFLTLIFYQRWRRGGRMGWYAAALLTFAAAALAKPIVVTLPALLLLYDYVCVDGRLRWRDTLPFFAVAAVIVRAAIGAHAAVGAISPPHGSALSAHVLMMSRVTLEYLTAMLLPLNLSPVYYYQLARTYEPLNFLCLAGVVLLGAFVVLRRRRDPWTFFCLGWFVIVLVPESNVVPVPQLRADRFLYLPMLGFTVWVAVQLDCVGTVLRRRLPAVALGCIVAGALGVLTFTSAGVWRDDVSAWQRVAQRHPWSAVAYTMLGHAWYDRGDAVGAEQALAQAVRLNPQLAEPHLYLAKLYAAHAHPDLALIEVQRYLALAPESPDGLELLRALQPAGDV